MFATGISIALTIIGAAIGMAILFFIAEWINQREFPIGGRDPEGKWHWK